MKRFLSLILTVTVLASMFSVGISVFADKTKAPKHKSFCLCKNSDGSCDSAGMHFGRFKVGSDGNRFAWGRNKHCRPNKFNVSSDGAWKKEFKVSSDGNRFTWGRNKHNRPNKFNVSSDGAWKKEFKASSDGNRFAWGRNK
ncbi:MAG: hypothetical protein J6V03_05915, partial [Clostridia bacterium]|nr:hypothetical protein [Clostridia bacterium]